MQSNLFLTQVRIPKVFLRLRYLFLIPFQGNCHVKDTYMDESLTFFFLTTLSYSTHIFWFQVTGEESFVLIGCCLLYTIFQLNEGLEVRNNTESYTNLVSSYKQSPCPPHRWENKGNKPTYFIPWIQLLHTLQGNKNRYFQD